MKIEIHLDIESIVREALRSNTLTSNITVKTKLADSVKDSSNKIIWEFAPKSGRRRNVAEIAMHELELKYGRLLTPEEKGETKAFIQVDEDTELKAKEDTLTKIRIDGMVTEGLAAASKELADEEKDPEVPQDEDPSEPASKEPLEATIPKTEELKTNSLFS